MKQIKKIASILLAMVMVLAMSVTAFAADVQNGKTYTAYLIFDKTSSGSAVSYSIDANSPWVNAVQDYNNNALGLTLSADGDKYVVTSTLAEADAADFANHLAGQVPSNAVKTEVTANGDGSANKVTFTDMDEGFYLITSSLGSAVATTNGSGTITLIEKNTVPTISKSSGTTTSVSIGDVVNYTLTYTDGKGTNKAVTITDTLPDTLTYNSDIQVKKGEDSLTENTDYTVSENGKIITITLTDEYITSLNEDETVTITYSATVNSTATSGTPITNNVKMNYNGEDQNDDNTVYTYDFNLKKVDDKSNGLAGAEFTLYKTRTGTTGNYTYSNPVLVTSSAEGYKVTTSGSNNTITSTIGIVNVDGLAAGTYYLVETKAPAGYKLQTTDTEIEIADSRERFETTTYTVTNVAGTSLPTTGGMGTTVLYAVGIILVLGAGILLVVRRRMNASR